MGRILVVEDARAEREELVSLLSGAGHEVRALGDGSEAVRAIRSTAFDLIVLDLAVPGGPEVLRVARQQADDDRYLPVLLVSAAGDAAARVDGLRLGADDLLARPWIDEELLARVEGLLRIKTMHDRVASAKRELERISSTDDLTGVLNRRGLEERLQQELARAQRYDRRLALALVDLDRFKEVNDRHGHLVGDAVLRAFAALLREQVRETDRVARFGGDEFVLLLPETTPAGACELLQRLHALLAERRFGGPGLALEIRCSAGIAGYPGPGVETAEDLLRAADAALYEAKRGGGDRICIAPGHGTKGDG